MKTGSPGMEAVRSSSRGHMDIMTMLFSLLYLPMECCLMALAFVDQLLSDILLSLGRPTPSQCAVRFSYELVCLYYLIRSNSPLGAYIPYTPVNRTMKHQTSEQTAVEPNFQGAFKAFAYLGIIVH